MLDKEGEWLDPESNRGHEDFQSSALPTELSSRERLGNLVTQAAGGKFLLRIRKNRGQELWEI